MHKLDLGLGLTNNVVFALGLELKNGLGFGLLLKLQVFRIHNDIISIFLPSINAANVRRRHSFMSATKLQLVVYRHISLTALTNGMCVCQIYWLL